MTSKNYTTEELFAVPELDHLGTCPVCLQSYGFDPDEDGDITKNSLQPCHVARHLFLELVVTAMESLVRRRGGQQVAPSAGNPTIIKNLGCV